VSWTDHSGVVPWNFPVSACSQTKSSDARSHLDQELPLTLFPPFPAIGCHRCPALTKKTFSLEVIGGLEVSQRAHPRSIAEPGRSEPCSGGLHRLCCPSCGRPRAQRDLHPYPRPSTTCPASASRMTSPPLPGVSGNRPYCAAPCLYARIFAAGDPALLTDRVLGCCSLRHHHRPSWVSHWGCAAHGLCHEESHPGHQVCGDRAKHLYCCHGFCCCQCCAAVTSAAPPVDCTARLASANRSRCP
jgi:hypothetical protein